mgnify:FL=1
MKKTLLTIIILFLGTFSVSAQLYRYLDTQQGLSSRRVIAVEKDQKGYMWFLTQEGVDRYNGKQFTNYTLSDGNRPVLHFPNLSQLHIDNQDDIWVTGKNGFIFKYNQMLDKYDLVMNFADSLKTKRRLPLTHTSIDRQNNLWLCTRNAQYIYRTDTKHVIKLETPIKEEVFYIEQAKGNRYFFGTRENVYVALLKGNRLVLEPEHTISNIHRVQHIHYHVPTDRLLIGTMADGFYVYDSSTKTMHNIGNLKDVTMNDAVTAQPSSEEVLIATDGNGVYKLNMNTLQLHSFLSTTQESDKMNGDIIKDIYLDEEGRVWMTVFPFSVTIYSDKYPKYEWLHQTNNDSQSLANSRVTQVIEDSDGDIWVTTNNGIGCYHTRTKQWTTLLSSHDQNRQDQNYVYISLCESTPGTILVGGYMSGMYRINKRDMRPQYFSPQQEGYTDIRPDKYIRSIYRDEQGTVWAGGYYNFKSMNFATGQIDHYQTEYPISVITSKSDKELWVGTVNGIYKFNKQLKEFQQEPLLTDMGAVNTIYQANDELTYIGTHGSGLCVYNNHTGELKTYDTNNSALLSNNIFCILPSTSEGELIISTENALVCFNTQEERFQNWTKEQGMLSENFSTSAGVKTHKGKILFGCEDGLIYIEDSIKLPREFKSKLVFSNLNIHYQQMLPGMEGSPLTVPIDQTEKITLAHDQDIFSIEVSSINYDRPSRILYSWKLEGFYNEWTKPSPRNLIRYMNLAPGDYTLKVRAILLDDGRTLEERSLRIHVDPPFSQTMGAYTIYILIGVLTIFIIMRYLWMRKESMLSHEKIQFFTNTAHDIRTPLTLIKGPLSEISRTEQLTEKGKENLQYAIRSTDSLAELANKLIDFQKEERYTSIINVSLCDLNQYIANFTEMFRPYSRKKGILLTFEGTESPLEGWIDVNKMDSILHNLLSNAMKYTPEGGQVKVTLQENNAYWTVDISDTGIGISTSDQKKMFKQLFRGQNAINQRITGSGIGMLQTYRLVKRHLGTITVASEENKGTTFHLRFPTDHKKYIHHKDTVSNESVPYFIPEPTDNSSYKPSPQTAPSLLIVEDNPDLRNFLRQSLGESYRITEAQNGQEALETIAQEQPDLIISDIMMPVMRGDDLCQTLKENMETSHIPIILLTALGDRESILHGLNVKADSYVVKPFDIDILKANIASVLTNKEILRKRFSQLDYQTENLPKEVQETPGLSLDQEFLEKITKLVIKNLGKDFNVDDLCLEMGMSRSSLYNKVKALTDHSPSDFIRQTRLKEGASLLRSKKYTVAEVSDMLGFSDPKYFTDIFKKHYGMTPSAYMKQT